MSDYQLIMPKMGESIAEATIIRWLKNEGETISTDESVLEIATDKVDSEVPTPQGGVLIKQLFKEGDVVPVGTVVAIISTSGARTVEPEASSVGETTPAKQIEKDIQTMAAVTHQSQPVSVASIPPGRFYSPLVLNIAKSEGISMTELETISGTGNEGRVTKRDILGYIQSGRKLGGVQQSQAPALPSSKAIENIRNNSSPLETVKNTEPPEPVKPAASDSIPSLKTSPAPAKSTAIPLNNGDEIIEMDRMRKLIAEHMVMSKHTSPHVTSFVEADVTNLVLWRDKVKKSFEKREGEKITFTPCFIESITKAIRDMPLINISVDGDKIIKRKSINIGMATALPSGNLIVPVIKNADNLNLLGLTKMVNDLANRARNNKLNPDDIQGGTFTITNVGSFGNVMGTPIINQPQVAIMATGTIKKKPAVMETEYGDTIAIRHIMFLSLSYDHRVVDGALGGSFLRRVADYLEQWDVNREI